MPCFGRRMAACHLEHFLSPHAAESDCFPSSSYSESSSAALAAEEKAGLQGPMTGSALKIYYLHLLLLTDVHSPSDW